jgi:predicted pyridoxine 5'-phosphate oxidase superfamily flavin-nucleotide-binding protein
MGILAKDMSQLVIQQRLSFVATVKPDGSPNLCPIGSLTVWDADHLVFAEIHSPQTVTNLRANPAIQVNVVDPIARKGFRFAGRARVLTEGSLFEYVVSQYKRRGVQSVIRSVVMIKVERTSLLRTPAYDVSPDEDQMKAKWKRYWKAIQKGEVPEVTGE